MPFNVKRGMQVGFSFEFTDSNGNATFPSSSTVTITYTTSSFGTASQTVAATQHGSVWAAVWDSTVAGLGRATASVSAAGLATPAVVEMHVNT